jgi:predicted RNA-binding protein with PIN domain
MSQRRRYLIVDGHSVIFAWPELRKLHERRAALARDALTKRLRDYQDWTGVRVVVVFDGKGPRVGTITDPHEIQIFYSRKGQTADAIIERLASKYARRSEMIVATSDYLEQQTASACGAECISPQMLAEMLEEAVPRGLSVRK